MLLRLARFEQLGDARQTAGDVLGLGGLARDLGDDVARLDGVAVVDVDVRADRQEVTRLLRRARHLLGLAVLVLDRDARTRVGVLRLDDDLAREAGDLVELLLHRHLVDDVAVLHDAGDLGEDRHRERIPLGEQRLRPDLLPVLDEELGAVGERVALALAAGVVGEDELAVAVHRPRGSPACATTCRFSNFTVPSLRDSSVDCSVRTWPMPPMWKVRIVSCVPGSPIDCAAMTPTASPMLTTWPRARSRP